MSLPAQIALPLLAFLATTGLASAIGVGGLGPAATAGELVFAATLVAVVVRGGPPPA